MDTYAQAVAQLHTAVETAIKKAIAAGALPEAALPDFIIETPADTSHGDFATNAAMAGAKAFRMPPFKIAQAITENLDLSGTFFDRFETAGPGFINFFLGSGYYAAVVTEVLADPEGYGSSDFGKGEKVMVEFVSANPTGPMHMGNARGGALGDCLAAVLDKAGYAAYREFYVNDAGNQIEKFANSLEARYLQIYKGDEIEFPEDGYQGGDITDLANEYNDLHGDALLNVSAKERKKALVDYALPKNIKKMQEDMATYRITYDKWFFESELHQQSGAVKAVVDLLTEKGLTYESEGAVWYKNKEVLTSQLLAEGKTQQYIDNLELKDDVLIRKNGNPTYFAADIAYHKNKFERGFTTLIDIWGADHHGHVMRMKGAMDAIGCNGDKLTVNKPADGNVATIELTAENSEGTPTYERVEITFVTNYEVKRGAKVYFEASENWGDKICAYVYNRDGDENLYWPGCDMTKESDGKYSYTLEDDFRSPLVIFNDGQEENGMQYPEAGAKGLKAEKDKTYQIKQ